MSEKNELAKLNKDVKDFYEKFTNSFLKFGNFNKCSLFV